MDLWVIAAAAGAGYAAKNLQNLQVDKKESLGALKYSYNAASKNFVQQLRDKTCPLRRLERQRVEDDAFLDVESQSDVHFSKIDRRIDEDALSGENRDLSSGRLIGNRRSRVQSLMALNAGCVEHTSCLCPSVRPVLASSDGRWGSASSFTGSDACKDETGRDDALSSSSVRRLGSLPSQGHETMLLFITGMTIGILCANTSWKNEVDKLNKQLRKVENLVQDLHEELDMKEMLMVKELGDESDPHLGEKDTPIQEPISSPSDVDVDRLNKFESVKENEKNTENLELLSRIEAELQAELAMLEENMKTSALERLSSVVELDPDFEPEIVRGDLKAMTVNDASDSGNETTDTTTNSLKPANYAVSPWELSLRLHELIESRLETRIKELEMALGDSPNMVSRRRFSYSETESSSTHQSPTFICYEQDKRKESSTQNVSSNYTNTCKDQGKKAVDQEMLSTDRIQNGEYDFISHHGVVTEDGSEALVQDMPQTCDRQRSTSFMYNEDSMSEDEGSDESEMLLIKHIIERRRSGCNFNLNIEL